MAKSQTDPILFIHKRNKNLCPLRRGKQKDMEVSISEPCDSQAHFKSVNKFVFA
jgi:hypothetical protein